MLLRLTHVATLVVDFQLPIAVRGFAPGVYRHERPLIEAGTRIVVGAAGVEGGGSELERCLPLLPHQNLPRGEQRHFGIRR